MSWKSRDERGADEDEQEHEEWLLKYIDNEDGETARFNAAFAAGKQITLVRMNVDGKQQDDDDQ